MGDPPRDFLLVGKLKLLLLGLNILDMVDLGTSLFVRGKRRGSSRWPGRTLRHSRLLPRVVVVGSVSFVLLQKEVESLVAVLEPN